MRAASAPARRLRPESLRQCPECGILHNPEMPHVNSVLYTLNFYTKNGCYPTWQDTVAHCAPSVRRAWLELLGKNEKEEPNEDH